MSVNKVIIVGRLGQNPEVKYSPSGMAIANLNLATNDAWTDKSGQKQEKTEWHRVVVFGKTAENCGQFLQKGRQVYVEGKLQTRQWQDQNNQTKYTTEIVAQTVQFLGGGSANADSGEARSYGGESRSSANGGGFNASRANAAPLNSSPHSEMPEPSFTEDDIPF